MGQFKGIDQLRSSFISSLGKLYDKYRRRLVRDIRNNSLNSLYWDSLHIDVYANLSKNTAAIYMASAMAHGMSRTDAQSASQAYARGRAAAVTPEIVGTTRRRQDIMDKELISRDRQGIRVKLTELRRMARLVIDAGKGRGTAINESTAAASSGAQHAIRQLQLEAEQDEWKTNPSLSKTGPCPVCKPLNGVTRKVWSREFPNGPPAHIGCVCEIKFKNIRSAAATAREKRKRGN